MAQRDEAEALVAKISAMSEPFRQWYADLDDGVTGAAQELLRGSIDMHLHCDPSPQLRVMDAFQAAEEASAAGMRAIVLKDHLTGMEDSAWLAMAHADVSESFDVFGSHWLNNQTGGWNVYAVDKAVAFGAKLVGAPTLAAYGEKLRQEGQGVHPAELIVKSVVPMTRCAPRSSSASTGSPRVKLRSGPGTSALKRCGRPCAPRTSGAWSASASRTRS